MVRAKGRSRSWRGPLLAVAMLFVGLALGLGLSQLNCRREAPAKPRPAAPTAKPEPRSVTPAKPAVPPSKAEPPPVHRGPEPPSPPLPRLALVIDDLGYAEPELVVRLCAQPVPFSVAVLPYLEHSRRSAEIAHERGKEVMLHLPMEPLGYPGPGKDPGPNAIFYDLPEAEVRKRVRQALLEVPFRKGVNNHMGSRITPDRARMTWILEEVKARQYFFVDSRTEKDTVATEVARSLGIPTAQRKVFLDDDKRPEEMERQWNRALALAEKEGEVLVIGHIYPETVAVLERLIPRSTGRIRFVTAGTLAR